MPNARLTVPWGPTELMFILSEELVLGLDWNYVTSLRNYFITK